MSEIEQFRGPELQAHLDTSSQIIDHAIVFPHNNLPAHVEAKPSQRHFAGDNVGHLLIEPLVDGYVPCRVTTTGGLFRKERATVTPIENFPAAIPSPNDSNKFLGGTLLERAVYVTGTGDVGYAFRDNPYALDNYDVGGPGNSSYWRAGSSSDLTSQEAVIMQRVVVPDYGTVLTIAPSRWDLTQRMTFPRAIYALSEQGVILHDYDRFWRTRQPRSLEGKKREEFITRIQHVLNPDYYQPCNPQNINPPGNIESGKKSEFRYFPEDWRVDKWLPLSPKDTTRWSEEKEA